MWLRSRTAPPPSRGRPSARTSGTGARRTRARRSPTGAREILFPWPPPGASACRSRGGSAGRPSPGRRTRPSPARASARRAGRAAARRPSRLCANQPVSRAQRRGTGTSTPSSRCHVDGVEAMIYAQLRARRVEHVGAHRREEQRHADHERELGAGRRVAPEPRVARPVRVRRRIHHAPEEEGHDGLAEHREQEAERRRGHRGPLRPRLLQDAAHARGALLLCCFARGFEEWCREVSTGPVQGGRCGIRHCCAAVCCSTAGKVLYNLVWCRRFRRTGSAPQHW